MLSAHSRKYSHQQNLFQKNLRIPSVKTIGLLPTLVVDVCLILHAPTVHAAKTRDVRAVQPTGTSVLIACTETVVA